MAGKKSEEMSCHDCGAALVRETRPTEYTYKGQSIELDQPAWWCPDCGEGVLVGMDVAATDTQFSEFRRRIDGLLSPADVRRIRSKLKLSQRKASALLGGGPHAFQRYEKGEVGISKAMSTLLRLLDKNPKLLQDIEAEEAA